MILRMKLHDFIGSFHPPTIETLTSSCKDISLQITKAKHILMMLMLSKVVVGASLKIGSSPRA